jgi:hypothetical protein
VAFCGKTRLGEVFTCPLPTFSSRPTTRTLPAIWIWSLTRYWDASSSFFFCSWARFCRSCESKKGEVLGLCEAVQPNRRNGSRVFALTEDPSPTALEDRLLLFCGRGFFNRVACREKNRSGSDSGTGAAEKGKKDGARGVGNRDATETAAVLVANEVANEEGASRATNLLSMPVGGTRFFCSCSHLLFDLSTFRLWLRVR